MTKQEGIREGIAMRLWCFTRGVRMLNLSNREWAGLPDGAEKRLSREMAKEIMGYTDSRGMVLGAEGELPIKLTSNVGCMSKKQIENFAAMVLKECDYPHKMRWTTAGDILIGEVIYIDERHIDEYPYIAKERILHEIAHIDTHPQDDVHGELFHRRLAELINIFMAGYVALAPLIEKEK